MRGQFTRIKVDEVAVQTTVGQEAELGDLAVGSTVRADMEVVADAGETGGYRIVSALDAPGLSWSAGRHFRVVEADTEGTLIALGLVTYDRDGRRVAHTPIIADGKPSKIGTDYQRVSPAGSDGHDEQYLRPKIKGGSGADVGQNVGNDSWAISYEAAAET